MWLQSLAAKFEAFEFKGVSATSSIAARFEMAAAVETVITEEAYTINIKTIVVKAKMTAAAKLELKESMIQLRLGFYQQVVDTLFSSRGGRVGEQ